MLGLKAFAEVPLVIPFSTAHRTALRYQALSGTSRNAHSVCWGVGFPWVLQRKVTTWALEHAILGEKLAAEVPAVNPFSVAQSTAL